MFLTASIYFISVLQEPGCQSDSDCSDSEKCVYGRCTEACRVDFCGINAQCKSQYHRALCTCPPGYVGNPHIECSASKFKYFIFFFFYNPYECYTKDSSNQPFQFAVSKIPVLPPLPECSRDDDCPSDKGCVNELCVNPCVVGDPCSRGAFCHVENHAPVCRCPTGYTGDPRVQCQPRKLNIINFSLINTFVKIL